MFTGVWKRRQKSRWCVEACATSVDHQILKPSKSVDEEAVMTARVHEHDLEVKNLREEQSTSLSLLTVIPVIPLLLHYTQIYRLLVFSKVIQVILQWSYKL